MSGLGPSGRIAGAFLNSKLTPLFVAFALLLGVFATMVTPREEEPQIVVPMIDVMVSYPGASAAEVEERVSRPMEALLWEIEGVEYVYSIAQPGMNMTIVRFLVGQNVEDSLVRLQTKLSSNYDRIPAGVSQPMVKSRSIDDVPVLALTLWSRHDRWTGYELRRVAQNMTEELKRLRDASEINIIGGQRRQMKIVLDSLRMSAYGTSVFQTVNALSQANVLLPAGAFSQGNREYRVEVGGFLRTTADVGSVVVGVSGGRPVYLRDIANITDGPEESANHVFFGAGPAAELKGIKGASTSLQDAVTLSFAKKKGTNATRYAEDILHKVESMRGGLLPSEIEVAITRNYGETAKEKSDELLFHMLLATISVVILIAWALGWRESVVVAVAVPVTLALTLLVNYLYGYTLNRVTLFALIFSIGILVDDAIVVVENIHRRFSIHGVSPENAVQAVDEVGNPTILATFAVIAALLPMAFVSGLMGPYMRPIPIGASAAMLFSLLVAFVVSPWLGYKVLRHVHHDPQATEKEEKWVEKYERLIGPLLVNRRRRLIALAAVGGILLVTLLLVPFKAVMVKMLPFDNKSELEIIIDMPKGTPLERTTAAARDMAENLRTVPEVTDFQVYVGSAAPYNFNGLVRHYFTREGGHQAGIQVNLSAKGDRKAQSHDIAKRIRPAIKAIADKHGGRVKVAEIPPGPPVLSTLVAEVYGPDEARRREIAAMILKEFETTTGVVDVDWFVEADQEKITFRIDRARAILSGVSADSLAKTLAASLGGTTAGLAHLDSEKEPVEIRLQLPVADRSAIEALMSTPVANVNGRLIPMGELVSVQRSVDDKTRYRKNLQPVTYVIGDVAGREESPIYAISQLKERISKIKLPEGYALEQFMTVQPERGDRYAMKWDGEIQITAEVFHDLGIAFAAVLLLIYVLVVAWFRSFIVPLIIMIPIPLTLVGILPGHWLFGSFFTATSMIGFIALSGIIVRNSILLVDFIQADEKEGMSLRQAVVRAGALRLRPIALTAAAVVVASMVMLFDPIFQGLAISMMFGAVVATALTLVAVPIMYFEWFSRPRGNATEK